MMKGEPVLIPQLVSTLRLRLRLSACQLFVFAEVLIENSYSL
jgi:hypothetical protein